MLTHKASIPQSYKLEKPKFPMIDESTELVDLVTPQGPHSFKFFSILGLGFSWLELEPGKWEEVDDFKTAKTSKLVVISSHNVEQLQYI